MPPKEENLNQEIKELDKRKIELKLIELKKQVNSILISSQYFFFNIMLHRFSWVIDFDCSEGCLGYIRFRNIDINEIENGSINISGWVLDKDDFTAENLLFLLVHELLHVIFMHGPRMGSRNPEIWNLAADQVINSLIKRTFHNQNEIFPYKGYGKNGGCIYYEKIGNTIVNDPKLSVEEVYEIFNKHTKKWSISLVGHKDGVGTYEVTDQDTGESFTIDISDGDTKTKTEIERFSRSAGDIYNNFKNRGVGSGGLFEVFSEFFKTELPWDKILENIIRKSITIQPNSRGWQTLNKIFYPHGFTLPGVLYEPEQRIDTGVVSIDTSGSISTEELQKFADILVESCEYFREIIMICHDHTITQTETFYSHDKENLKNFIQTIGFKGRGGTSHKDVFQKIQELQNESYNGISIYLSLTDGYSDIDQEWSQNSWCYKNEISTCFILTKRCAIPKICESKDLAVKYVKIPND